MKKKREKIFDYINGLFTKEENKDFDKEGKFLVIIIFAILSNIIILFAAALVGYYLNAF